MESPKLEKTSQIWLQGFDALMRLFFTSIAKVSWKLSSLLRASRRDARGHMTSSHQRAAPKRDLLRTSVLLKAGPRGMRFGENYGQRASHHSVELPANRSLYFVVISQKISLSFCKNLSWERGSSSRSSSGLEGVCGVVGWLHKRRRSNL